MTIWRGSLYLPRPCLKFNAADDHSVRDCPGHTPNGTMRHDRAGKRWHKCANCPAWIEGLVDREMNQRLQTQRKIADHARRAWSKLSRAKKQEAGTWNRKT